MAKMGMTRSKLSQSTELISARPVDVSVSEAWDPGFGDFMETRITTTPRTLITTQVTRLASVSASLVLVTVNE